MRTIRGPGAGTGHPLFSDIANFAQISENLPPEELVEQLNEYLSELSARILQTGGTVNKYIGDAIMAFWGAPADHPQHAAAACTAVLQCQHALRQMRIGWSAAGKPAIYSRIGLHTGEVVIGNIKVRETERLVRGTLASGAWPPSGGCGKLVAGEAYGQARSGLLRPAHRHQGGQDTEQSPLAE